MYIKEVSKLYGVKEETLRYYEKIGMIPPVHRTESGIRDYSKEDLGWVENALCMRRAGMPVSAIAEYVQLTMQGDETLKERLNLLMDQKRNLENERAQLDAMITRISGKIDYFRKKMETRL
ncbi:hypothetical protein C815_02269 [Firmicutes bacterium M10-2]|nr:hypothetical protein C815_02269 [Firmicutes bacterium M10-2]